MTVQADEYSLENIHNEHLEQYQAGSVRNINIPKTIWQTLLPKEEYHIMWENGTERAFSGEYYNLSQPGIYRCGSCGHFLFDSTTKFDSKTGWPSFWQPLAAEHIIETIDKSWLGITRIELSCARCGAHLGHVFEDGPQPTGLRYCINSRSLRFLPRDKVPNIDKH